MFSGEELLLRGLEARVALACGNCELTADVLRGLQMLDVVLKTNHPSIYGVDEVRRYVGVERLEAITGVRKLLAQLCKRNKDTRYDILKAIRDNRLYFIENPTIGSRTIEKDSSGSQLCPSLLLVSNSTAPTCSRM